MGHLLQDSSKSITLKKKLRGRARGSEKQPPDRSRIVAMQFSDEFVEKVVLHEDQERTRLTSLLVVNFFQAFRTLFA